MDFVDVKESVKSEVQTEVTSVAPTNSPSDNTVVDETVEASKEQQVSILDVPIENENMALNVLVSFVNLGQRRGVFNIQESAKIWECIQKFKGAGNK
jgi:hypothetical protein